MDARILQVNFKFNMPPSEYAAMVRPLAGPLSEVPGCRWKIWLMNEAGHESGGIYLFDDAASLQGFLNGPIIADVSRHPALTDFSVKQFEIMPESVITRAPIGELVHA